MDETKKTIATTLLNSPKTDFRIGKPELQKYMKPALCKDSFISFDQPVTGIKPTFLRTNAVVCWNKNSSFQQINHIVLGLKVINVAAEPSVKYGSDYNEILKQVNNNDQGCRNEGGGIYPPNNLSVSRLSMVYICIPQ